MSSTAKHFKYGLFCYAGDWSEYGFGINLYDDEADENVVK